MEDSQKIPSGVPDGEPDDESESQSALSHPEVSAERLLPFVYDELREAARQILGPSARNRTLQPTVLVHSAYLKLAGKSQGFENRRHFFFVAAKAMRQVVRDHARQRRTRKRGGAWQRVTLSGIVTDAGELEVDTIALDEALEELAQADPRAVAVVELRFFAGLTIEEVAATLGRSPATIKNDWRAARAWLCRRLAGSIE